MEKMLEAALNKKKEFTISVTEWATSSELSDSTRKGRRKMMKVLAETNGRLGLSISIENLPILAQAVESVLEDIRSEKVTLYQVSRKMLDTIRQRMKPSSIYQYRSQLPLFFKSTLGESKFNQSEFDRLVPAGDYYPSSEKLVPSRDETREMLKLATPQYRAVVGGLACSGMRIGEWISRKMSDLEIRPQGYARIKLQASETKARSYRYVFLTKEVVDFVKQYHAGMKETEWVFPGEVHVLKNGRGPIQPTGKHLDYATAEEQIKRLFRRAGLKDKEDGTEIYTAHSFRSFTDRELRKCGLSEKYVELTIGHKNVLAASASYKDWEQIEKDWFELCEVKLTWLSERIEVVKEIVDTQARRQNKFLLELLGSMLTPEQRKQLDTMIAENEDLKALELFPVGTLSQMTPEQKKELQTKWKDSIRKRLEDKTKKSV